MIRKLALCSLALFGLSIAYAQKAEPKPAYNINPDKQISHFASIQANQLIQQIFSFGPTPAFNNPYLLKYSVRFNGSNNEFGLGLGANLSTNKGSDGIESINNRIDLRLGYCKKFQIGKRFEAGVGVDAATQMRAANSELNRTTINQFGGQDSTITKTKASVDGFGGGPQFNFAYYISKNIKIGTEATYYFWYTEEKSSVETQIFRTDFSGSQSEINSESNDSNFGTNLTLNLPVALFLTIRF
ncbi:hypothetical protein KFE98_14255 [bacterium SCSIO 12741]|nr:hypothetical protein KFE98_14255 [bacterium SCSIO 12741]